MTPRLAQLYAVRMQIDALIAAEESETGVKPHQPEGCPFCGAPEEKQVDSSTLTERRMMCLMCKKERPV